MAAASLGDGVRLRWNRNKRTVISLRHGATRREPRTLSIHVDLPGLGLRLDDLAGWLNGAPFPEHIRDLFRALDDVSLAPQRAADRQSLIAQVYDLGAHGAAPLVVGGDQAVDLGHLVRAVQEKWFADLPPVVVQASRQSRGPVHQLRFGSYTPSRRLLRLHPRLAVHGLPAVVVEYVIFHELCHHRQACQPLRGEKPHSSRFRQWEAEYPLLAAALVIEKFWSPALHDPERHLAAVQAAWAELGVAESPLFPLAFELSLRS